MRLAEAAYFLSRYRPSARVDEVFHTAGVPRASHLRARRLGLVALVARRLGVRVRGTASPTNGTLVEDSFADRWSFPGARIGWTGVYAGEDDRNDEPGPVGPAQPTSPPSTTSRPGAAWPPSARRRASVRSHSARPSAGRRTPSPGSRRA